jgi:hypothetical protein
LGRKGELAYGLTHRCRLLWWLCTVNKFLSLKGIDSCILVVVVVVVTIVVLGAFWLGRLSVLDMLLDILLFV